MKTINGNMDDLLMTALCRSDVEWLKAHAAEFDINHRFKNSDDDTLLLYALSDSGSDAYRYLLKQQADVFATNNERECVFHSVVYSNRPERFDDLLKYNPETSKLLNSRSNDEITPLLLAMLLEKHAACEHLVRLGANVNLTDNENYAPIHQACQVGNLSLVKLFVEHGADLNIKTLNGNLPMALAINEGHEDVVKYLLSYMPAKSDTCES